MRGQAAFEYLIMFSIVLTILAILTYYAQDMTEKNSGDIISSNVVIAVNKIAEAADIVYTQGAPSQITLSIYIPENINNITFNSNMIDMKVQAGSGISDVIATSKATFCCSSYCSSLGCPNSCVNTGCISIDSGTKRIKISAATNAAGGSYVNVTEG